VSIYGQLNDPYSPTVRVALTRKCRICQANAEQPCVSPVHGGLLAGRLVHYERTGP
jgi:hypothetical protein